MTQKLDCLSPNFAEYVFDWVKKSGATSASMSVNIASGYSATSRMGSPEQLNHLRDQSLKVTVYQGHRQGKASTTDLSAMSVQQTVKRACRVAMLTQEDPCLGLADQDLMANTYPDLALFHDWDLTPEQALELAIDCEKKGLAGDPRIKNSEGATVDLLMNQCVYSNTHGFWGTYKSSVYSLHCILIAEEAGRKQRDFEYTVARHPKNLMDIDRLAELAAQNTVNRLGDRQIATQSCPVIFNPRTARSLLSHFIGAITGSYLYRNMSFLKAALGQPIFPAHISFYEQPHEPEAMGSVPFDGEGVRVSERCIVHKGVLEGYVLGSYSARKLGMHSTGNADGVHNLSVSHEDYGFSELVRKMGKGLVVTELMGDGVNLVTGDYSQGVFGYWVENGEIQHPVGGINIAGNLRDMFLDIQAIANDVDHRGNIRVGSVLIKKMMVSGAA